MPIQFRTPNVDRTFGRTPRHALGITAVLTVAMIAAKIKAERRRRRAPAFVWQDPAEAIRNAIVVCRGVIVPTPAPEPPAPPADPSPTTPMSRAELAALVEVDGGRPMHELDFALVTGGAR